jgi:hypothetical protein
LAMLVSIGAAFGKRGGFSHGSVGYVGHSPTPTRLPFGIGFTHPQKPE